MAPPKKKTPITYDQRLKLFLTPCKNKKEVQSWIKYFLGLDLPDTTVSRFATTNPLEVVYEIYTICVLGKNPENIQELLYTASRGSGKTLGAAIAEFMVILHDQRDIAHVGAILQQAKRAYEYVQGFCLSPNVRDLIDPQNVPAEDRILQKSTMEKSVFRVKGQICSMEVLPTTLKALNGVHVSLVSTDELDTLSGEGLRAIKEVAGMLDTKKGKKPLRVGISTRKSKHGIMNRMIENADKEGRKVRFWTALEFTEKCPDTRSGIDQAEYWINQDAGETLTHEEYLKKDNSKKKDYVLHSNMYTGCHKCPVAPFCLGDAKKQTSKSNMLKSIDELNQKIRSEGYDWAASQLFNLKPSTEGIVFKEFEERTHVKTWNQMWFTLTGKEFPGECTHDLFVKKCHEMKLPCYGGVDWGWSAPNTVVYFFVDKKENVYVVRCDGLQFVSQPSWIHHMKTKYQHMYKCQLYVPDAADQGAVQEMIKAGLPVANKPDKGAINTGIQVIKKFLRFPGTNDPKIFFAKETCSHIVVEMSMYHYKLDAAGIVTDDPDTEYDHWIDALRYPLTMLFGKQNIIVAGGGLDFYGDNSAVATDGSFAKMPSPQEYAASKGITLNDQNQDLSKLGRVGTLSELDDDSDDDGNDSGGGTFSWSF